MLGYTPLDYADSEIISKLQKDSFFFQYNDAKETRTYDELLVEYAEYCADYIGEYMPFDEFIDNVVFGWDSDCTVYVRD